MRDERKIHPSAFILHPFMVVYYLHGDHLGSTSLTTDQNGAIVSQARYLPYGETRWGDTGPTDFGFTGQRNDSYIKLIQMGARWYDPYLNRFVSPDTIVPDPINPQNLNRYTYAANNPVKYRDPSGHWVDTLLDVAFITYDLYEIRREGWTPLNTAALAVDVACAALPIATGGGPGLRLAFAGGETLSQAAVHVPAEVGALQGIIKFSQLVDGSSGGGSSGETSETVLEKTQQGVNDAIAPHLNDIKKLAPDAEVGFRGSLARGTKGPHKGNAPFDPTDFDVDGFIVSDQLASRYSKNEWWRSGDSIPELNTIQQQIDATLRNQFPGIRDEPFTFRIYTRDEFARKVQLDEQFFVK